jgi:hypothetical protein
MSYRERHVLAGGLVLETALSRGGVWALRYGLPGAWLVAYKDGVRVLGGQAQPYEFKSVEQLRYDFERDVQDAQHPR